MIRILVIFIFFTLLLTGLFAQTIINEGDVSGVWTKAQSPYHINGDVTIPNDSTLTIKPGVLVEFQGHYALEVKGQLLAVGSENDTIRFTVNDTTGFSNTDTTQGGWSGVRFIDTPVTNDSSQIAYCRFQYGKAVGTSWPSNSGGALCVVNFSKLTVSNCIFINNLASGPESENPSGGAIHFEWSDISISYCTFIGNRAFSGGAVQFYQSSPVIANCTFESNVAFEAGGLQSIGMSTSQITDCSFTDNQATELGGAIRIWDNTVTHLNNITFSGNSARDGGGIAAAFCELYISNCDFIDNTATNFGAGIHSWENDLNVTDCRFEGNISPVLSGGIHSDFTDLVVKRTVFRKNSASLSAGIHSWYSDVQVQNCQFEENTADHGAGLHCDYSHMRIDSSNFIKNTARSGAGVHAYNSDLQINNSIFEQNEANVENGGAILYSADSTIFGMPYKFDIKSTRLTENISAAVCAGIWIEQVRSENSIIDINIDNSEFIKNHSDRYSPLRITGNISNFSITNTQFRNNTSTRWVAGPGFLSGCSGTITNSIFSSNYSTFSDSTKLSSCATLTTGSQVDFFNCTFFDSSDAAGYGISMRRQANVSLTNCILWGCGDRPVIITTADSIGCQLYVNYCDIENGSDSIFVSDSISTLHWGTGNIAVDPYFADIENSDFHLSDSSLCLGAGVNCYKLNDEWRCAPEFDIEGNVRPAPVGSNADMGAYESDLAGPTRVESRIAHTPDQFTLFQNYPNPFNPVTAIGYQLSAVSDVDLSIYNTLGQKIVTLVSEKQNAGRYQVKWHAGGFASGIYIYRIKTDHWQDVKKMILVR
jgi:predicted outer membrane repeat protein